MPIILLPNGEKVNLDAFHVLKPYYKHIQHSLSPACNTLFYTIAMIFNANYFPPILRITSRELSDLSGLSYANISRIRAKLTSFLYQNTPILKCTGIKENSVPLYSINYNLFCAIYYDLSEIYINHPEYEIDLSADIVNHPKNDIIHPKDEIIRPENDDPNIKHINKDGWMEQTNSKIFEFEKKKPAFFNKAREVLISYKINKLNYLLQTYDPEYICFIEEMTDLSHEKIKNPAAVLVALIDNLGRYEYWGKTQKFLCENGELP